VRDRLKHVKESEFEEERFFAAIANSGARSLLIGRRAMIALGLPVMTRDYDFWVAADDAEAFNRAVAPLGLAPNRPPDEARKVGLIATKRFGGRARDADDIRMLEELRAMESTR
jgi:hypothetical protein